MNHHDIRAVALTATLALLAACTTPQTATHYARQETRMLQQVQFGVLVDVRQVVLDGAASGQGATAGAVLGALPGVQQGDTTRAALGGLVGTLLGPGVEELTTRRKGLELLIKLEDGSHVSVTQETDGLVYTPGQRVRVITLNGAARVVHHTVAASADS